MAKRPHPKPADRQEPARGKSHERIFYLDFLTPSQKEAFVTYQDSDVTFLSGPAGCGKTFLATGFAIKDLLDGVRERIILTRPIVEAGESLGFLPGTFEEKVDPYMAPLYDCISKLAGLDGPRRERIESAMEIVPLAYIRGRTLDNAVCVLDEAQNCSFEQLVLFLTRLGENSKMIITGDPAQSDIFPWNRVPLSRMIQSLAGVPGIGNVDFPESSIVRHPMVTKILRRLRELKEAEEGGSMPPPPDLGPPPSYYGRSGFRDD